ncbi:LuxR C-terminal-related transcriptional regulator [Pseudomonas sp. SXM-1]|uniref:LuxR C-terminal-related transcriptional regulator n=1 Tax=Pseudomonas sp. SXM-1 TaxID=2169583 RepID=UPI0015AE9A03|nr:LuxR C-terminal-related transcriptional regulator [Pseudomonas sp. SXM-1]
MNTWVSFESAEQPLLGQFSVSGNTVELPANLVLLEAISQALKIDTERPQSHAQLRPLQSRFEPLAKRERAVLAMDAEGILNKQIGEKSGIAEVMAKVHRHTFMEKRKPHNK